MVGKRGNQGWSTKPKDGSPAGNRGWSTGPNAGRPKGDTPPRKTHSFRASDEEYVLVHRFIRIVKVNRDVAAKALTDLEAQIDERDD